MQIVFIFLTKVLCLAMIATACVQFEVGHQARRSLAVSPPALSPPSKSYSEIFLENRDRLSTVYLRNGNALTGEIVHYAPAQLTVEWKGALITFSKAEILKIGIAEALSDGMHLKASNPASWPHANNPVIELASGGVIDGSITRADTRSILVREVLGEGRIEYDLPAGSVKAILWRPYSEEENAEAKRKLVLMHPGLLYYAHSTATLPTPTKTSLIGLSRKEGAPSLGSLHALQKTAQSYVEFWRYFKTFLT